MDAAKIRAVDTEHSKRRTLVLIVAIVQFLTPFMFSAVGVALPAIGREFSAAAVHLSLIEMVYVLAVALLLLPAGRFGDIHGRKKVFITGIVVLTLATIGLSLAPSIRVMILFRLVQGVGAALITSTSLAILTSVFPKEELGRALAVVVSFVYLGIAAGPTLAGIMVSWLGWRWIFYSAVPIELLVLIITVFKFKEEWIGAPGEPFDFSGSILYMGSLFCLIIGMTQLTAFGWAKFLVVVGVVGLFLFLYHQSRQRYPLVEISTFIGNKEFLFSCVATWLNYAAIFGVIFYFSIYLQVVKGLSPRNAGFILAIQPVTQMLCATLAGRLADKYNPASIATIGMAISTIALLVALTLTPDSGFPLIVAILILMGIGFAIFATPNTKAVMGSVSRREYGMASSVISTMRSTGALTCMTLITLVIYYFMGENPVTMETIDGFLSSMRVSFVLFAGMGSMAIVLSFYRLKRDGEKS